MTAPQRSTAVATVEPPAPPFALSSPIAKILDSTQAKAAIMPLLPHGVDWQQAIIEVHRAAVNEPKILKCTEPSIVMAVGLALQTGLVIGKTIHLVPVNKKVGDNYEQRLEAWTDYKGDIELVMRSGAARFVDAQAVYAGDDFSYELGDTPWVKHRPQFDATKRGALIGAYCVAWINNTGTIKKIVVLPLADIEKVRKGSKQWSPDKVKDCPPWYAIKTAVHLNCKAIPRNPRLAEVLALFAHQDEMDMADDDDLNPANRVEAPDPAQKVDGLPAGFAFAPKETPAPSPPTATTEPDAPATVHQLERIEALLSSAAVDLVDEKRDQIRGAAKKFTAKRADEAIAYLEGLVPVAEPADDLPF